MFVPPAMPFGAQFCTEQNWSNYVAHLDGFAIHPLSANHHWMHNWDSPDAGQHYGVAVAMAGRTPVDDAQFLHFYGMGRRHAKRLRAMREAVAKWR